MRPLIFGEKGVKQLELNFICGQCGKKISNAEAPFKYLKTILPESKPHFSDIIVWASGPYCSEACFKEARARIRDEVNKKLNEDEWARKYIRSQGFKVDSE